MRGDREECLEAGMDGYLSKPINTREMIALVEGLAAKAATDEHQVEPALPDPQQERGRSCLSLTIAIQ
jgi:two-component system, sensor histidine kinase and response regulator